MHARGRAFADGIKALDRRAAIGICRDPAHVIVGRGHDRDRLATRVQPHPHTGRIDRRKRRGKGRADGLRRVQKRAAPVHLGCMDGAGHLIARRQIGAVGLAQQVTAISVDQPRPFAPQGLSRQGQGRDQFAVRSRRRQADGGRMELHKLGVQDLGPGLPGQRHARPLQRTGRGRPTVQAADASGCQDDRRRDHPHPPLAPRQDRASHAAVCVPDQPGQPGVFPQGHMRTGPDRRDQRRQDGPPGPVAANPRHPRPRMGRFPAQVVMAVRLAVEGRTQPVQPFYRLACRLGQGAGALRLDQSRPGCDRILGMQTGCIVIGQRRRHSPLRPGRGTGLQQGRGRRHQHRGGGRLQRRRQSGQPAADDQRPVMANRLHRPIDRKRPTRFRAPSTSPPVGIRKAAAVTPRQAVAVTLNRPTL